MRPDPVMAKEHPLSSLLFWDLDHARRLLQHLGDHQEDIAALPSLANFGCLSQRDFMYSEKAVNVNDKPNG